jgi:hypothetical protein
LSTCKLTFKLPEFSSALTSLIIFLRVSFIYSFKTLFGENVTKGGSKYQREYKGGGGGGGFGGGPGGGGNGPRP